MGPRHTSRPRWRINKGDSGLLSPATCHLRHVSLACDDALSLSIKNYKRPPFLVLLKRQKKDDIAALVTTIIRARLLTSVCSRAHLLGGPALIYCINLLS